MYVSIIPRQRCNNNVGQYYWISVEEQTLSLKFDALAVAKEQRDDAQSIIIRGVDIRLIHAMAC